MEDGSHLGVRGEVTVDTNEMNEGSNERVSE